MGAARGARAVPLRRVGRAGRRTARSSCRRASRPSTRRSTSSTASSSPAGSTSTRRRTAPSATEQTDPAQAHRDAGELALLERALERDVPTLAICRGFQLLNVAPRRRPVQHLPETVGHEGHREVLGHVLRAPGRGEGGDEARGDPRPAPRQRAVEPPPGRRPRGGGARRDRVGRGRLARGRSRTREALRGRRALAPRDGGGQAPVRGARRRGPALSRRAIARPGSRSTARDARPSLRSTRSCR